METSPTDKVTPSIPQIDDKLLHIVNRLSSIDIHLRSSVYGETPNDENGDKSEIPTPSLESVVQRISSIQDSISNIETHLQHLHS